ncbi:hypothetical protein ACHAQJ_006643 [Trichoderma viride]
MPPPRPATSTSTENLLLKCQKETRKKCLPPEWSIHPPNQEIRPPPDTLALAIQVDSSSPNSVNFFETDSNRSVGSIGPEYRGSIVVVPWRPGLKFVCVATCRRRSGCRVGVVREAKGVRATRTKGVDIDAASATSNGSVVDNMWPTTPISSTSSSTADTTPGSSGDNRSRQHIMGTKRYGSNKHVSFADRSISGKSSIKVDNGRTSARRS